MGRVHRRVHACDADGPTDRWKWRSQREPAQDRQSSDRETRNADGEFTFAPSAHDASKLFAETHGSGTAADALDPDVLIPGMSGAGSVLDTIIWALNDSSMPSPAR